MPACEAGPNRYPDQEFGAILTALETGCGSVGADAQLSFLPASPRPCSRTAGCPTMMGDQVRSAAQYGLGASAFSSLGGCGEPARKIADGLARYLALTAERSSWIDGCEAFYATRYSRSQCQCVAERIRAVDPAVHEQQFSRDAIPRAIRSDPPFLGVQIAACGVVNY